MVYFLIPVLGLGFLFAAHGEHKINAALKRLGFAGKYDFLYPLALAALGLFLTFGPVFSLHS